ncbi:hypothetical protein BJV74DRAFT_587606 [Russula compacta]|nr:hypothetical protein BJV74DRAFT_587606 [Russula compacta]
MAYLYVPVRCWKVHHCLRTYSPTYLFLPSARMVNFHDPSEVAQVGSVLVKFWHTLAGLYIWEFVTTLDYEWGVIRGHRPYRWSIWIYSLTRSATLVAIILDLILLDTTVIYNCQVLFTLEFISGSVGVAAASFLIVLRIIAIWRRNRVVIVIALAAWGINIAIHLQSNSVVCGCLAQIPASFPISKVHSTSIFFPRLPPTSSCFPSCSLACSACAVMGAAPLLWGGSYGSSFLKQL